MNGVCDFVLSLSAISNFFILTSCYYILAPGEGIEPPLTVLETAALPLYYPGIVGVRSRIRTDGFRVLQTLALGHSAILTFGTGTRARTENLLVKSQLLYL